MFKIIGFFFKSSWKQIMLAAIASAIAAGLNILSLRYLRDLVSESRVERIQYVLIVVGLVIIASVVTFLAGRYITGFFEHRLSSYREELATRILQARYEKVKSKLDRLVPVLLFEIDVIGGFGKLVPEFIVAALQTLVVMSYLIYLSWQLSVIVIGLLLIVVIMMLYLFPKMKKLEGELSKTRFGLHVSLDVMEKGFKDLALNRAHALAYVHDSVRPQSEQSAQLNTKVFTLKMISQLSINAMIIIGFGISLLLYTSWIQVEQQELVQFMVLLLFILPSLVKSVSFFNQVKKVENSLDQINALDVDIQETRIDEDENIQIDQSKSGTFLSLKDVSYSYGSIRDGFKLGPVSFDILENEVTIINGGNGSGKSTLFMLLAGLYTPIDGEIVYQGVSLQKNNMKAFRNEISCYFTDSPIFDNLSYVDQDGVKEINESLIEDLELQGKTDLDATTIANTNLSHGQRGRLNLLRLLLEDKQIFMLDEWAANQDPHFKDKFYKEIIPKLKAEGKTIVLVSHDDKYFEIADRIVTLENGDIIANRSF